MDKFQKGALFWLMFISFAVITFFTIIGYFTLWITLPEKSEDILFGAVILEFSIAFFAFLYHGYNVKKPVEENTDESNHKELIELVKELKSNINKAIVHKDTVPELNSTAMMKSIKKEVLDIFSDDDIIKSLQQKKNKLDKIPLPKLQNMLLKLENKILKDNTNKLYKDKLTNLINNKIIPMGNGTSKDNILNTYFNYYNEKIICKKSIDKDFIICKTMVDYELINNSDEEISQEIFTVKSFEPSTFNTNKNILKLLSFDITIDGVKEDTIFDEKVIDEKFKIVKLEAETQTISTIQPVRLQLQEKIKNNIGEEELIKFSRLFKKSIRVKKEIEVIIPYSDTFYAHVFHRAMLNYSFDFRDENALKVDSMLNSAFHKRSDDTIVIRSTQDNEISVNVTNDLILPKEAIIIISKRN